MKYFHVIYSQFNLLGDISVQGLSRLANCPTSNNCIAASYYSYGALYTISTSVYLFAIALS